MIAFLPPSSRWTCLRPSAAAFVTSTPVSREPVNVITRHVRVAHECVRPPLSPKPWTTWTTPSGSPASCEKVDETLRQERGVLRRLQHDRVPAHERRAGASTRGSPIGKFQGVIAPTTPTGIRRLIMNLSRELAGRGLPEQAAALAAHVVAHVDRFLDVAAGLGLDLPHLACHQVGEALPCRARAPARSGRGCSRARGPASAASPPTPRARSRRRG